MDNERRALLKEFQEYKSEYQALILKEYDFKSPKNAELSEASRKQGNALYGQENHTSKSHREVLNFYCKSVLQAPAGSEHLAFAYGNRSAFLLHVGRYPHCIADIDRALDITSQDFLKVKLLCRKVQCLKASGSKEYKNVLKDAKSIFIKISNKQADKKNLGKLIENATTRAPQTYKKIEDESTFPAEAVRNLARKDISKVYHNMKMERDEKYGNRVIANKDFFPGEIIFVDENYSSPLTSYNLPTCCQNCAKFCWSGIPCENCTWATFCNEECQKEAWEKYHSIECAAMTNGLIEIQGFFSQSYATWRMLLTAIKEYDGDISKLKAQIDHVDSKPDSPYEGFEKNGKFESSSASTVYSLINVCNKLEIERNYEQDASQAIPFLIYLAKYTKVFGENFKLKKIEDLMNNEDAVFLGSLYIRFTMITSRCNTNGLSYEWFCERDSGNGHVINQVLNECCTRFISLVPIRHLFNHSCFPNAGTAFLRNLKFAVYALHPIKKGSEIFLTCGQYYEEQSKLSRTLHLKLSLNITCECIACRGDWSTMDRAPIIRDKLEAQLMMDVPQLLKVSVKDIYTTFDMNDLEKIARNVNKGMKLLKLPSDAVALLIHGMRMAFGNVYGLRPPVFGPCRYD